MTETPRIDEFIRLLTSHELRIRSYILTLVPNWADSEEILQETCVILWRKFSDFKVGTNFFAWACKIARYEVMTYRRKKSRQRLIFNDEFIHQVADEIDTMRGELEDRQQALTRCIKKLPDKDRNIVEQKYMAKTPIKDIATRAERSIDAIYKSLSRIRRVLFVCIQNKLASGESA